MNKMLGYAVTLFLATLYDLGEFVEDGKPILTGSTKIRTEYGTLEVVVYTRGSILVTFKDLDDKQILYRLFGCYNNMKACFDNSSELHAYIYNSIQ